MATWTHLENLDGAGHNLVSLCAMGTKIYYIDDSDGAHYEYDIVADVKTRIDSGGDGGGWQTTVFRDRLYNVRTDGGTNQIGQVWNGVAGDYTTVIQLPLPKGSGSREAGLYSHGGYLATVVVGDLDVSFPNNFIARHTTNGTSWDVSTLPIDAFSNTNWAERNRDVEFPTWLGIVETFVTTGPVRQAFSFSNGIWSVLNAALGGTEWAQSSGPGIWWANYQVGDKWTKDFVSFTTPAGSVTAAHTFGLPATSWGVSDSGTSRSIYRFDGTAWVLLDTITIGGAAWQGADRASFIRIGDDIYHIGEISATITAIYKRDEPLPSGRFYYGQGNLVRRSDAPILSTNPGALALMGKTLLAGSSVNNEVMVGYADEPTYEAWTDYTGILSKTAPIKSFSATPWGDSEDLEASEDAVEGGGFQGGTGGRCS